MAKEVIRQYLPLLEEEGHQVVEILLLDRLVEVGRHRRQERRPPLVHIRFRNPDLLAQVVGHHDQLPLLPKHQAGE